jgi:hypothetical protein
MSHRQVPNILFPAIIVSSAVFGLLTLPFFYAQTQNSPSAKISIWGQELQPILATRNRNLTIRYIGGAMVISVVVGFGTVELRRRLQKPPSKLPDAEKDAENQSASQLEPNPMVFLAEAETTHLPPEWLQPDSEQPMTRTRRWPILRAEAGADVGADVDVDAAVVELSEAGEICQISVQPSQRRLIATEIAGQYYSFFQSVPTRDAAWEIAQQLSQTKRQILITPIEQEYAVWVLQPQAKRDLNTVS